jgi:hypothetical protein
MAISGPALLKIVEDKIPKDLLPDLTTEEKLLAILNVWQEMRISNDEYIKKFDGLIKDLEFTLNLLNLAEKSLVDSDLKTEINNWLEYYRNLEAS